MVILESNFVLHLDTEAYELLKLLKASDTGFDYEELQRKAKQNRIVEPVQAFKRLEGQGLTRLDRLSGGRGWRFKAMPKAFTYEIREEA